MFYENALWYNKPKEQERLDSRGQILEGIPPGSIVIDNAREVISIWNVIRRRSPRKVIEKRGESRLEETMETTTTTTMTTTGNAIRIGIRPR